jgi:hypothetical protein
MDLPFPQLEIILLVFFGYTCIALSWGGKLINNSWWKRNWQDFVPSFILVLANINLFVRYGDLYGDGQISAAFILITSGTISQVAVWWYQLWIQPNLGNATTLRAGLGVSIYLDTMGLATTIL